MRVITLSYFIVRPFFLDPCASFTRPQLVNWILLLLVLLLHPPPRPPGYQYHVALLCGLVGLAYALLCTR
jgi:hypothetical protein